MKIEQQKNLNNKFFSIQSDINDIENTIKTISNKVNSNTEEFDNITKKLNNKIDINTNNLIYVEKDLIETIDYKVSNIQKDIEYKIYDLKNLINKEKKF